MQSQPPCSKGSHTDACSPMTNSTATAPTAVDVHCRMVAAAFQLSAVSAVPFCAYGDAYNGHVSMQVALGQSDALVSAQPARTVTLAYVCSVSSRTSVALKGIAHTSRLGLNTSPGAHPGPYQFSPYLHVCGLPIVSVSVTDRAHALFVPQSAQCYLGERC